MLNLPSDIAVWHCCYFAEKFYTIVPSLIFSGRLQGERFEVFAAMLLKIRDFWNVTPCLCVNIHVQNDRLYLRLQDQVVSSSVILKFSVYAKYKWKLLLGAFV